MLGFSPLSTNPVSAIDDLLRLESSALLDSMSIVDSSAFIRFIETSKLSAFAELQLSSKNIIESSSNIDFIGNLLLSSQIKIPQSAIFFNQSEVVANYLSTVHSNCTLDIYSKLDLDSYLSNSNSAIFNQSTELNTFAKIKLFSLSELPAVSQVESFGNSKILEGANFSSDVNLISTILSRTVGNVILPANSTFELNQYIKSHIDLNFEASSNLILNPAAKYFNSTNFEIVGVLSGNISQVNRDIVYYILYIDKIKPFNLYIAKVK